MEVLAKIYFSKKSQQILSRNDQLNINFFTVVCMPDCAQVLTTVDRESPHRKLADFFEQAAHIIAEMEYHAQALWLLGHIFERHRIFGVFYEYFFSSIKKHTSCKCLRRSNIKNSLHRNEYFFSPGKSIQVNFFNLMGFTSNKGVFSSDNDVFHLTTTCIHEKNNHEFVIFKLPFCRSLFGCIFILLSHPWSPSLAFAFLRRTIAELVPQIPEIDSALYQKYIQRLVLLVCVLIKVPPTPIPI